MNNHKGKASECAGKEIQKQEFLEELGIAEQSLEECNQFLDSLITQLQLVTDTYSTLIKREKEELIKQQQHLQVALQHQQMLLAKHNEVRNLRQQLIKKEKAKDKSTVQEIQQIIPQIIALKEQKEVMQRKLKQVNAQKEQLQHQYNIVFEEETELMEECKKLEQSIEKTRKETQKMEVEIEKMLEYKKKIHAPRYSSNNKA